MNKIHPQMPSKKTPSKPRPVRKSPIGAQATIVRNNEAHWDQRGQDVYISFGQLNKAALPLEVDTHGVFFEDIYCCMPKGERELKKFTKPTPGVDWVVVSYDLVYQKR